MTPRPIYRLCYLASCAVLAAAAVAVAVAR
jgi:hypothetical protein